MDKLNSIDQLKALRERLMSPDDGGRCTLVIPAGTCGKASGADEIIRLAGEHLRSRKMEGRIGLRVTGCHGFCQAEPSVLVEPARTFYAKVTAKTISRIVDAAAEGQLVEELLPKDPQSGQPIRRQEDHPFFRKQVRTLLSRNEKVDPTEIESHIRAGGYSSLAEVLRRGDPRWVVEQVKASGLRGRGGAGFPTGSKWEMLAARPGEQGKVLVCNADEGDPGAYMDRSILEGNPHSILEGMLIGAYATGATRGVIYVRNEYPLAVQNVAIAIRQARELGLLGTGILGTALAFDVQLVQGAGAFVCGEETALIRSVEGKIGEPRQRPPFPIEKGIDGKPTAINNVETLANIPVIIEGRAEAFARVGTPGSTGTKVFSLVGKIRNTGLAEVPMGITIGEIVNDIGGGPSGQAKIKAVQTGGPSGGCIPAERFHLPIDYDSLAGAGSIMGSGGMIVMDEGTCMVDVARYFMNFLKDESCGRCFTCRKGTQRMHEILQDISNGEGTLEQLGLLEELATVVKDTSLCGLGQTAANPVLSTLRYFRQEYLEHIEGKRCPAGVCKALIAYTVNENCTGCQACAGVCPAGAVTGGKKVRHAIEEGKCVLCGACRDVCKHQAVDVVQSAAMRKRLLAV